MSRSKRNLKNPLIYFGIAVLAVFGIVACSGDPEVVVETVVVEKIVEVEKVGHRDGRIESSIPQERLGRDRRVLVNLDTVKLARPDQRASIECAQPLASGKQKARFAARWLKHDIIGGLDGPLS